jgi:hypothetical protein
MDKCLNCGHELVSEYESQICMQCAGELPARVSRRFPFRNILTTLHVHRPRPVESGPPPTALSGPPLL